MKKKIELSALYKNHQKRLQLKIKIKIDLYFTMNRKKSNK